MLLSLLPRLQPATPMKSCHVALQTCRLHKILAIKGCIFVKLPICRRTLVQQKRSISSGNSPILACTGLMSLGPVLRPCQGDLRFTVCLFLCAFRGRHSTLGLSSVSCFATEKQELSNSNVFAVPIGFSTIQCSIFRVLQGCTESSWSYCVLDRKDCKQLYFVLQKKGCSRANSSQWHL